ncbi:hypothetical protein EYM_02635 [Ignicoccus islandicus DSM 13165]|uniref:DUF2341 domain-containing protein n=1 Tax=Ignicoccus islandicus DSM 13165 TaxID=940295 RepID=A0A0U3F1Z3_9CREN|nr:DUF2341 domain-containing protein [Ignicoccus islandicus]ALU11573.1 hypothetical protein EYM_02635 [Ignicoccus islandicus DSM 13165]
MRALAITLLIMVTVQALSLTELWSYVAHGITVGIAFSEDGKMGIAPAWDGCAHILDPDGNLINKFCGKSSMDDVSYLNNKFGFVNFDGYAYILNPDGTLWKKIYVGSDYGEAIVMLPNGFIACWYRCAYFDFNGNEHWDINVGVVEYRPSVYNNYIYIADMSWDKLIVVELNSGNIVKEITYDEPVDDTAVCGKYLAVTTDHYLYLYEIDDPLNPRELWKASGFDNSGSYERGGIAFSPDCRYLAVADRGNNELKLFNVRGELVLTKEFPSGVWSVAWWNDRIAIGLGNHEVHVYKLEGYTPTKLSPKLPPSNAYVLTVTNPNSYGLEDYQVRVELPEDLKGKPISITYNGNSVPFCYETSIGECTTDPAQGNGYVWIKVPVIPANGQTMLNVIVGTNGAVNGDQVFDFYDDFNSGISWSKWLYDSYYVNWHKAGPNGYIEITADTGCDVVMVGKKKLTYVKGTVGLALEWRQKYKYEIANSGWDVFYPQIQIENNDCSGTSGRYFLLSVYGDHAIWKHEGTSWKYLTPRGTGSRDGNWHLYQGIITRDFNIILKEDGSKTIANYKENSWIGLSGYLTFREGREYIDWVRVRKYADIEPYYHFQTTTSTTITKTITKTVTQTAIHYVTSTITKTLTVTPVAGAVPKPSVPQSLKPLIEKMYEPYDDLDKAYNSLSKVNNPLVDAIRKEMQKRAWSIAELGRVKSTLNQLLNYLSDYLEARERLEKLLDSEANYTTVFEISNLVQRMKVDYGMMEKLSQELANQVRELKANEPSVDLRAVKAQVGDLNQLLNKLGRKISVKEMFELKKRIEVVGIGKVIDAYLKEKVEELKETYDQFSKAWNSLMAQMKSELGTYEEIAKVVSG